MGYFAGKRILITGAGSGLGRRMALGMAREGGIIIAWDLSDQGVLTLLRELKLATGRDHFGFVCDVADADQVYEKATEVGKGPEIPRS